jgi:sucrose phosphorylase
MVLRGVPAIYFNSLIGAPNNIDGVRKTGHARTINRQKWDRRRIEEQLQDSASVAAQVLRDLTKLLAIRRDHPAFHPHGGQEVIDCNDKLFAVQRTAPDGSETVVAISNLTDKKVSLKLDERFGALKPGARLVDLLRKRNGGLERRTLSLGPYRSAWLTQAAS